MRMDGRTDRRTDGRTEGRTDGRTDGRMDGRAGIVPLEAAAQKGTTGSDGKEWDLRNRKNRYVGNRNMKRMVARK